MGTANVCGAGWVVPAKYYQTVGRDGFVQKLICAGPYRLVAQQAGAELQFEAFDGYHWPVHVKNFTIRSVPDAATRRRGARARRGRHHLRGPGRTDGAGEGQSEADAGAGGVRRITAAKWQDVFPRFISTGYAYPWEDIQLKA